MKTRREALKAMFLVTGALAVPVPALRLFAAEKAASPAPAGGPFTLPPLGYAFDALEPHIDAQTMQIHHGKHHASYVEKLNAAIAKAPAELQKKSIEELLRDLDSLPENIRTDVRNNGGGHANHTLFWSTLKKDGGKPAGEFAKAMDKAFGSLDGFQGKFSDAATKLFGSGWAWLAANQKKELSLETSPNQDSLFSKGLTPLLGIDVWEHAYYLKYQNRRADYVKAFPNVINWEFVSERYARLES